MSSTRTDCRKTISRSTWRWSPAYPWCLKDDPDYSKHSATIKLSSRLSRWFTGVGHGELLEHQVDARRWKAQLPGRWRIYCWSLYEMTCCSAGMSCCRESYATYASCFGLYRRSCPAGSRRYCWWETCRSTRPWCSSSRSLEGPLDKIAGGRLHYCRPMHKKQ